MSPFRLRRARREDSVSLASTALCRLERVGGYRLDCFFCISLFSLAQFTLDAMPAYLCASPSSPIACAARPDTDHGPWVPV